MFSGFYITTKGKALLAKAQAGRELNFTRFQVGEGFVPSGQSIVNMMALVDPVGYFSVASCNASNNTAVVAFQLTNVGMQNSWYFREVGLFANDPDDGEILYAYGNAGENADLIPAVSAGLYEYIFSLNCAVDNSVNVVATIDEGLVYASKKYVDNSIASLPVVSIVQNGLMSAADKKKLDGVEEGATKTIIEQELLGGNKNAVSGGAVKKYVDETASCTFDVSGQMVTGEFAEGTEFDVVSHVEPVQSGSGDPSPSNVRPISGCTGAKLIRTNNNLLGGDMLADNIVEKFGGQKNTSNSTVTFSGGSHLPLESNVFQTGKQYTAILYGKNSSGIGGGTNLAFFYTDGTSTPVDFANATEDSWAVVSSVPGKTVASFGRIDYGWQTILYYNQCGIFEGVIGTDAFEPYQGNQFAAPFGQTIYGGEYNWKTGVLKATHKLKVLDGSEANWTNYGSIGGCTLLLNDMQPANVEQDFYCSMYPVAKTASMAESAVIAGLNGSAYLYFVWVYAAFGVSNIDEFKSFLAQNPMEVVYKLNTPKEIQLTPQQILSLDGENNVWSDCGETSVKAIKNKIINDFIQDTKNNEIVVAVPASAWVADGSYYKAEVGCCYAKSDNNLVVGIDYSASAEQYSAAEAALIQCTEQDDGKIVLVAYGEKPSKEIPVKVVALN